MIVSMLEQPNSELMNQYGIKAVFLFTQVNRQRLTKLAEWVDQNNIKVNIDKTFSLDEAAKALDYTFQFYLYLLLLSSSLLPHSGANLQTPSPLCVVKKIILLFSSSGFIHFFST